MLKTYITAVGILAAACAAAATQPDQVTGQKAVFNEAEGTVTVSGKLPAYAYDPEYYIFEDLDHISEVVIERHTPSTGWPADAVVGRLADQQPGADFEFTDENVVVDAKYEYRIICYVDQVKGFAAYANVYTGIIPGELIEFKASTSSPEDTSVTLVMTAPELSLGGTPLADLQAIDIEQYEMFSYTPLHTIENPVPGQSYTWTHEGLEPGKTYYYRARARRGETGYGDATEADTFVGLDLPGKPIGITATQPSDDVVLVAWTPAAEGLRGGSYRPEETVYKVERKMIGGELVEIGETGTGEAFFEDRHGFAEETLVEYVVTPRNETGESYESAVSPMVAVGAPAALPFAESFAYTKFAHNGWSRQSSQDDEYYTYKAWDIYRSASAYHWASDSYIAIEAQDEDLGFATCLFYSYSPEGQTEGLVSPRIAIGNATSLELSFFYHDFDSESSGNSVTASWRPENGEWSELFRSEPEDDTIPGWTEAKLEFPVSSDTGNIQIRIEGVRGGIPIVDVFVDNILLREPEGSGIMTNTICTESPKTYFTLQGIPATETLTPGIYIERQGNKTRKIQIR